VTDRRRGIGDGQCATRLPSRVTNARLLFYACAKSGGSGTQTPKDRRSRILAETNGEMSGYDPEVTDSSTVLEATPAWTRKQAADLTLSAATVAPEISPPIERIDDDLHIWDTWLLRERDGRMADVGGYRVFFALTAPADVLPGKRHDVAAIRYFYSRDGRSWTSDGTVFDPEEAFGSRQWAGSALYDDGEVYAFYTAAGRASAPELTYEQRVAVAGGGRVRTDADGVHIDGPWSHEVLFDPDGVRYERAGQGQGMIYTFRDPWFFEDPAGETCLLFEANLPIPEGSAACGGDREMQSFNGCVGLAVSPTGDPTDWVVEGPLLHGACVNQELERPHVLARDGQYYLFVDSHGFTFAPGLDGYEALYGFVADDLRGDYRPLNGGGVVVANPSSAPHQAYSWLVYPHADGLLVTSFLNYHSLGGMHIDEVGDLPEVEQQAHFGGTLAPTLRLDVEGDQTRLTGQLDPGHLPRHDGPLPDADVPDHGRAEVDTGVDHRSVRTYGYATSRGRVGRSDDRQ